MTDPTPTPTPTRADWETLVAHNKALIDRNVALREAVNAAWNDAIEAVRPVALTSFASGCDAHELDDAIRALCRAAPTEDR